MTSLSTTPNEINTHHEKVGNGINEKTEQQQQQQQQQSSGIITPPLSPVTGSVASSNPTRHSLRISAGQTGLPWLAHDADGDTYSSVIQNSNSDSSRNSEQMVSASPPPKFMAHPRTASIIRFPTRKRRMQKHVYSMNDGMDPVKVLCKRLLSWKNCVKYLINMFHRVKKVESNTSKNYRKIDSKFSMPSAENQFRASNGVQDAWSAFRQYTRENSLVHQDYVDFIENEIIPSLKIMIKDIDHMSHSLKTNKNLYTASLFDDRKHADKVITKLNKEVYNTANMVSSSIDKGQKGYVLPKNDPLLTKYLVINTIRELHKQENTLHKSFLETQDKYRQFEQSKIIDAYTRLFQRFEEYRTQHDLERLESVEKVVQLFNAIETDAEWTDFLKHHEHELVKRNASFKNEVNFDFPNQDNPLIQPVIHGVLQRHHSKKWIEDYYILSPVGLLHRFKSEADLIKNPLKPDLTLFIPESTLLVNPTNNLLELRGKTLGLFGGKKLFELSSSDPNVLHSWITHLDQMALQRETVATSTPVNEPVGPTSVHSKIEADHPITNEKTLDEEPQELQHQQQQEMPESSMQPIMEHENENKHQEEQVDDNETITHVPSVTNDTQQEHENMPHHKEQATEPLDQHTNNTAATPNVKTNGEPPSGPTREGSDLFWDPRVDINFDK